MASSSSSLVPSPSPSSSSSSSSSAGSSSSLGRPDTSEEMQIQSMTPSTASLIKKPEIGGREEVCKRIYESRQKLLAMDRLILKISRYSQQLSVFPLIVPSSQRSQFIAQHLSSETPSLFYDPRITKRICFIVVHADEFADYTSQLRTISEVCVVSYQFFSRYAISPLKGAGARSCAAIELAKFLRLQRTWLVNDNIVNKKINLKQIEDKVNQFDFISLSQNKKTNTLRNVIFLNISKLSGVCFNPFFLTSFGNRVFTKSLLSKNLNVQIVTLGIRKIELPPIFEDDSILESLFEPIKEIPIKLKQEYKLLFNGKTTVTLLEFLNTEFRRFHKSSISEIPSMNFSRYCLRSGNIALEKIMALYLLDFPRFDVVCEQLGTAVSPSLSPSPSLASSSSDLSPLAPLAVPSAPSAASAAVVSTGSAAFSTQHRPISKLIQLPKKEFNEEFQTLREAFIAAKIDGAFEENQVSICKNIEDKASRPKMTQQEKATSDEKTEYGLQDTIIYKTSKPYMFALRTDAQLQDYIALQHHYKGHNKFTEERPHFHLRPVITTLHPDGVTPTKHEFDSNGQVPGRTHPKHYFYPKLKPESSSSSSSSSGLATGPLSAKKATNASAKPARPTPSPSPASSSSSSSSSGSAGSAGPGPTGTAPSSTSSGSSSSLSQATRPPSASANTPKLETTKDEVISSTQIKK